jgi:hypothetical protein
MKIGVFFYLRNIYLSVSDFGSAVSKERLEFLWVHCMCITQQPLSPRLSLLVSYIVCAPIVWYRHATYPCIQMLIYCGRKRRIIIDSSAPY